jgi:hypothetical protein
MTLSAKHAEALVGEADVMFRLRPEELSNPDRKRVLVAELLKAFERTDVKQMDVSHLLLSWRRSYDGGEEERIRTATRPTAWQLRELYDQARRQADEAKPALGCQSCGDRGRRTIIAVVLRRGMQRVEPLVVACKCGQGDSVKLGDFYALQKLELWNRQVSVGEAKFQGVQVILVVDAPPVYGDIVLNQIAGLAIGEVVPDEVVRQVYDRLQSEADSC